MANETGTAPSKTMEWKTEQDLGGLGLADICRETNQLVLLVILQNFDNVGPLLLSALLLATAAASSTISSYVDSDLDDVTSLPRLVALLAAFFLIQLVCVLLILVASLLCTAAYAFCIVSLYRTGGDIRAADRVLTKDLPVVPLTRLACMSLLLAFYLLVVAVLLLWLGVMLGLAAYLAGTVYAAVVGQLACVVSVLKDAVLLGAVRRSRELLARKFCPAAYIFVTLDGCIIASLMAFSALVVDDALGLGLAFQVAAGVAVFVALHWVIHFTLVVHTVVYMVCKSYHHEVVDMAHLE